MYKKSKLGVSAVAPRPLTEPENFHFATDDRIAKHHENDAHTAAEEQPFKFKASSLRREIFEKKMGIPEKKKIPVTEPKSPAITKVLKKKQVHFEEPKAKSSSSLKKRKNAEEPFELPGEKISRKKRQKFAESLKAEEEELKAARQFHSNPLPPSTPDVLPAKKARTATKSAPFHLITEERGAHHQEKFEMDHKDDGSTSTFAPFKAAPLPPDTVFIPKKSTKALTQVDDIVMHTEERLKERSAFEAELELKQKNLDAMKRQDEVKKAVNI